MSFMSAPSQKRLITYNGQCQTHDIEASIQYYFDNGPFFPRFSKETYLGLQRMPVRYFDEEGYHVFQGFGLKGYVRQRDLSLVYVVRDERDGVMWIMRSHRGFVDNDHEEKDFIVKECPAHNSFLQ